MLIQEHKPLLIGQVAAQSGIPIKTIRYYEELGLLKSQGRTEGGFDSFHRRRSPICHLLSERQLLGSVSKQYGSVKGQYSSVKVIGGIGRYVETFQKHVCYTRYRSRKLS